MTPVFAVEKGSRILSVQGLDVCVRVEGSGEPLLLLNGMARPLDSWTPVVRALTGRTIITFDAPGIGSSPTPMFPLSMQALAKLTARVLDAVGFDSADVVGFSHGGAVAQQLSAYAPERVHSLVLASTSCGLGAVPGDTQSMFRGMLTPAGGMPWPRPDPLGLLWQVLAIATWSSIPFLGTLDVPTLVVCGTHDRIVPPANSALLAERIPKASLAAIEAGHDLQRGEPALALAALVQEFLSQR